MFEIFPRWFKLSNLFEVRAILIFFFTCLDINKVLIDIGQTT